MKSISCPSLAALYCLSLIAIGVDPSETVASKEISTFKLVLDDTNLRSDWWDDLACVKICPFDDDEGLEVFLELRDVEETSGSFVQGMREHFGIRRLVGTAWVVRGADGTVVSSDDNAFAIFDTGTRTFSGEFFANGHRYKIDEKLRGPNQGQMNLKTIPLANLVPRETGEEDQEFTAATSPIVDLDTQAVEGPSWNEAGFDFIDRLGGWELPRGHNFCELKMFVDFSTYDFFERDAKAVTKYIMQIVEGANSIYKEAGPLLWKSDLSSETEPIQFRVKDVFMADEDFCQASTQLEWDYFGGNYSYTATATDHYLCNEWDDDVTLLKAFSDTEVDLTPYCMGLLLTAHDLSPAAGVSWMNGACSGSLYGYDGGEPIRSLNAAVVSINDEDEPHTEHTLAHELGHSLGAYHHHDVWWFSLFGPEDEDDLYLMDPYVPDNIDRAEERFSKKSLDSMKLNLLKLSRNEAMADDLDFNDGLPYTVSRRWCFVDAQGHHIKQDPNGRRSFEGESKKEGEATTSFADWVEFFFDDDDAEETEVGWTTRDAFGITHRPEEHATSDEEWTRGPFHWDDGEGGRVQDASSAPPPPPAVQPNADDVEEDVSPDVSLFAPVHKDQSMREKRTLLRLMAYLSIPALAFVASAVSCCCLVALRGWIGRGRGRGGDGRNDGYVRVDEEEDDDVHIYEEGAEDNVAFSFGDEDDDEDQEELNLLPENELCT